MKPAQFGWLRGLQSSCHPVTLSVQLKDADPPDQSCLDYLERPAAEELTDATPAADSRLLQRQAPLLGPGSQCKREWTCATPPGRRSDPDRNSREAAAATTSRFAAEAASQADRPAHGYCCATLAPIPFRLQRAPDGQPPTLLFLLRPTPDLLLRLLPPCDPSTADGCTRTRKPRCRAPGSARKATLLGEGQEAPPPFSFRRKFALKTSFALFFLEPFGERLHHIPTHICEGACNLSLRSCCPPNSSPSFLFAAGIGCNSRISAATCRASCYSEGQSTSSEPFCCGEQN